MDKSQSGNSSPKSTDELLYVIELEVTAEQGIIVEEILAAHALPYAFWQYSDQFSGIIRIYCETEKEADHTEDKVRAWIKSWPGVLPGTSPAITRRLLLKEDWAESWKKYFTTMHASSRIVIKPTWEDYAAGRNEIVLEIDPGMSFGTGRHGTTQACLQFMDELSREIGPVSFLDAGCGSGILSLAAWQLGFRPIYAFDNDPAAVGVARENLAKAASHSVHISCGDLETYRPAAKCRVVVANILAVVLLKHAEKIASFLNDKSEAAYLILSGILIKQYPEVKARFTALGMQETATLTIADWKSACFRMDPES